MLSMKGRNEKGYPLEGVDVIPEQKGWRPFCEEEDFHMGKIEYSLARLVELLKDANKCVGDYKDGLNTMNQKYNNLHDDYIALRNSASGLSVRRCQILHDPVRPTPCVKPAPAVEKPLRVSKESWRKSENRQDTGKITTRWP